ncbi:type 2 periplasmic-binding domain-containing protein [Actinoallomurus bryophytorum]|uniref:hypothetical protein n=1 Tax=Actinoallomurus bryophytorum TaxID=1490222 RepID=UPI00114FCDC2|nr:hypothetical protein [Actinoallomurus bryophytorum]
MDLTPLGRQFLDELGPAYAQVQAAIARATATGHGTTGELHLGYMSAALTRRLLTLVDTFHARSPAAGSASVRPPWPTCTGRYAAPRSTCRSCRCPFNEPDLTVGPVVLSEAALLAVPADHRLVRRTHLTPGDLTDQTFLFAQDLPGYWIEHHLPIARPAAMDHPAARLPGNAGLCRIRPRSGHRRRPDRAALPTARPDLRPHRRTPHLRLRTHLAHRRPQRPRVGLPPSHRRHAPPRCAE